MVAFVPFSVLFLGSLPDIDPIDGNDTAELATLLENRSFGNFTPSDVVLFTPLELGGGDPNRFDQDNTVSNDTFKITQTDGSESTRVFDSIATYNATVRFGDGTSVTGELEVFQDTEGSIWVAPPSYETINPIDLEAAPIRTIQLADLASGGATSPGMLAFRNLVEIQTVPCFAAGTLIRTVSGDTPVEKLQRGDMIITRDRGPQPIRWIGTRRLDAADLRSNPKLLPIRITAGTLGKGAPAQDLVVSPQHRILVRSKIAQRMFGTNEVLVAAKQLLEIDGIETMAEVDEVTYVHFMFDQHEVVFSNGAETESLYAGAEALKSVGPAAREELMAIFPELDGLEPPLPARMFVPGRNARKLAARHQLNAKPLQGDL